MKKRGVRLPDLADAFLLTFACSERHKERYRRPEPRPHSMWAIGGAQNVWIFHSQTPRMATVHRIMHEVWVYCPFDAEMLINISKHHQNEFFAVAEFHFCFVTNPLRCIVQQEEASSQIRPPPS